MEGIAKLIEIVQSSGPGAFAGFSVGLLFFIGGLPLKKWVMYGQFQDMKDQLTKSERESKEQIAKAERQCALAERDRDNMRVERDELRIMVAGALVVTRKNALLVSSVMQKQAAVDVGIEGDDGAGQPSLGSG